MSEQHPGDAGSVTVSEFMFLALGLVLGVASGAAFIEIIRARPPARREVRLTVAKDAIPRRRGSTLADDAFVAVGPEPARGGPADRRAFDGASLLGENDRRTNVPSGRTNVPSEGSPSADLPGRGGRPPSRSFGMPVASGADPMLGAIRASAAARGEEVRDKARESSRPSSTGAVALLDPPAASAPAVAPSYSGPCADERRLADERCELASRAQERASAAADGLRRAQRDYDAHSQAAAAAAEAANPLAVRSLKEGVQRDFRAASQAAGSPEAVEAAARTWLQEINRINREAAAASLTADRERDAATSAGASLERLGLEANAARIGAEMANAACVAARTVVADCDEQSIAGAVPSHAAATAPPPAAALISDDHGDEALGLALEGGTAPRIFRLLRGDSDAMDRLVATLAGGNPAEVRRWNEALSGLTDAIVADAIEQGYLRFPHDHQFWGPYTLEQNRDVTLALASLGYRFDGLAGWLDERQPAQRELSLALGYAGLDPMRVRGWPNEEQTAQLFRDVEVAADEYLAGAAGDLTLAEMVEMLGRRADNLVDLWNNWGRVRPLLLEEA
jgi:hypothetical protein